MTDKLKVVDLKTRRDAKEDEDQIKWKEEIFGMLDDLKKAVEEGDLTQIILQYETKLSEEELKEEPGPDHHTVLIHWNKNQNMDEMVGSASRLNLRLLLMAEGLIE